MSYGHVNGAYRLLSATISVPKTGTWTGMIEVDHDETLTGQVTIVIGDRTMVGTIRRGTAFNGAGKYLVYGGAAAWQTALPAKGYQRDGGVQLSTLLSDLARETGETVASGFADRSVGEAYVREAACASRTLGVLVGRNGWYIGDNGETVIGTRPSGNVEAEYEVLDYSPEAKKITLATETPSGIDPGLSVTVEGESLTLSNLTITLDGVVGYATDQDVTANALRTLVREELSKLTYLGVYEYRVSGQSGDRLTLRMPDKSLGLPDLSKVAMRPGIPGANATVRVGSAVIVQFVNGDPSRPMIVAFAAPDGDGFVSPLVSLDADSIELGSAVAAVLNTAASMQVVVASGSSAGTYPVVINSAGQTKVIA